MVTKYSSEERILWQKTHLLLAALSRQLRRISDGTNRCETHENYQVNKIAGGITGRTLTDDMEISLHSREEKLKLNGMIADAEQIF